MVPANSTRASPTPTYSGFPSSIKPYQYGTLTPCGLPSQTVLVQFNRFIQVLQPLPCRNKTGLGYFPFARHYLGNHFCFLFLRVLRCFSSPGSLLFPYVFRDKYLSHPIMHHLAVNITECQVGSPIRTSMDQSLFPAPHGLTQGITSFIASCCQGIHQTPFSRLI